MEQAGEGRFKISQEEKYVGGRGGKYKRKDMGAHIGYLEAGGGETALNLG